MFIAAWKGHIKVVNALIAARADVNKARDYGGATPLIMAAQMGHIEVVNALIAARADVNKAVNDEWTPLMCAAAKSQTQVVQALLSVGAKWDEADWAKVDDYEGITVLGSAPAEIVLLLQQVAQT